VFGFLKKKRSEAGTLEQVLPRIKHLNFLAATAEFSDKPSDRPVTTPLVADLIIAYAFDLPHAFQFVMQHDLDRLGVTVDAVRQRALTNLIGHMPPVELVGDEEEPSVFALQCGDHLEACMLLVPEYWEAAAANLPTGKLVVAGPTRDLVMLTSSESISGLEILREVIRQAGELEDRRHNLSKSLLNWKQGRWTEYCDPAAG
jgi:uncharacterized protein YtpQ (UPF0354 family)